MDAMTPKLNQSKEHQADKDELIFPTDVMTFVFFILIFCIAIFAYNQKFLLDPDTYWHIETGRWIWTEKAFPRTDVFSHTALGQPWTNMEWLAQIILFFSYDLLGWRGPILLSAFIIALTFSLMYFFLSRKLRATVAMGICGVSIIFAGLHFLARPHLTSYPLIVIWTAFLAKACEENRRPSYWLLPLVTLWANLHGAFTFGLVLAAGFGFEAIVSAPASERRRVALQWIGFCFCALLAGCITPYGYQYVLETFNVLNLGLVLQQNSEWRPMDADNEYMHEAILLILLALALTFGVKLRFPRALLVIGVLHFGFKHVRGLPMVALTWPFMLAGPLSAQFAFLRPAKDPMPLFGEGRPTVRAIIAGGAATALAVVMLGALHAKLLPVVTPAANVSPQAAVDYVVQQGINGPVLNDFDFGGYLIHRGIKTFIDGRTLPFGKKFSVDYFDAMNIGNLPKLDEMADTYKVTWTLLRPNTPMAYYFQHSPNWKMVYSDDVAVIHVRR